MFSVKLVKSFLVQFGSVTDVGINFYFDYQKSVGGLVTVDRW
jgi:hypothetical protein